MLRPKWKMCILLCVLVLAVSVWTTGAEAATRGKMKGEKMKYFKEQEYFVFEGNTRTEYKDYIITADAVQYYEKEERAIYTGEIVVLQGKNKITGQKMTANLKTDEFVIEGDVYIYYVRNEKNKTEEEKKAEPKPEDIVEIRAGHVVYTSGDDDEDHLVATQKVVMVADEDTIKADYLEYKGGEEVVFARGNVEVLGKDEEKIVCEDFTYYMEGDDEGFDAVGGVELEFTIDDDEDEKPADKPANPSQTPTAPDAKQETQPVPDPSGQTSFNGNTKGKGGKS